MGGERASALAEVVVEDPDYRAATGFGHEGLIKTHAAGISFPASFTISGEISIGGGFLWQQAVILWRNGCNMGRSWAGQGCFDMLKGQEKDKGGEG